MIPLFLPPLIPDLRPNVARSTTPSPGLLRLLFSSILSMIYAKATMQLHPSGLRSDQHSSVSYLVLDSDLGRRGNTGSAATPKAGFYTPEKVDPRQVESMNWNLHTQSIFCTTAVLGSCF